MVVASSGVGPSVGPGWLYKADQVGLDTVAPVPPVEGVEEASEFFIINREDSWRDTKVSKVGFHKAMEGSFGVYRSFKL